MDEKDSSTSSKAAINGIQSIKGQNVQRSLHLHIFKNKSDTTNVGGHKAKQHQLFKKAWPTWIKEFPKSAHVANLNYTDTSNEGPAVVNKEVASRDPPDSSMEGNGEDKNGEK